MKKVKFFIYTLLVSAVACVSAYAQEQANTDENSEQVEDKGIILNKFKDNTFIGINGDITGLTAKGNKTKAGWAVEATIGKWFTPVTGARIGYSFINGKEIYEPNYHSHTQTNNEAPYTYNFHYIHGDALINLTQWIGGYDKDRIFNIIPYAHVGYLRIGSPNDHPYFGRYYDNELGAGPGLILRFQLKHNLGIDLDLRDIIFSERFHNYDQGGVAQNLTASIGVNFGFGRYDWDFAGTPTDNTALINQLRTLENAQKRADELAAANGALADKNKDLQDKYNQLLDDMSTESPDVEIVKLPLGIAPIVLYYDINSTTLGAIERKHLDYYVRNVLDKDPNRVLHLTGSADKGTGTPEINARLSAGRAEELKQLLISEYGLKEDQIVVNPGVIADNDPYGRLDRSVTIEH